MKRSSTSLRASAQVVPMPNTMPRKKWVDRITTAWRKQIPSIFETGNLLESAKEELFHGEWKVMIKDELPFNRTTAFSLITIAQDEKLRDVHHGEHLPVSWRTLYELTRLTAKQFEDGIKSGAINPKMERKDVRALRGIEAKKKEENPKPQFKTLDEWCGTFSTQITFASATLPKLERLELFQHLQCAIAELTKEADDD